MVSSTGLELPATVAGLWRLRHWGKSDRELLAFIEGALELGINTFDHAMVYRSEAPFGQALRLAPYLRERMVLISKCGIRPRNFGPLGAEHTNHYDSSPAAIVASVEASLAELGTDYLDLLLIHRPDYLMDAQAVAQTLLELRQAGKVRQVGVSNFSPAQFELLQHALGATPLLTNQVELSPMALWQLDSGVLEQCQRLGIRPMAWSPLAGGQLLAGQTEQSVRLLRALAAVGEAHGSDDLAQVVYAWIRRLPAQPVVVTGTSSLERLRGALASEQIVLTHEQWYSIWEASNGTPVP